MPCPTCDHTMQQIGLTDLNVRIYHCPRCGTLRLRYEDDGDTDFTAKLVDRIRNRLPHLPQAVADDFWREGIQESVGRDKFGNEPALIVRSDHADGTSRLVDWEEAEEAIKGAYEPHDGVMKRLALGHPVRCMFATYQHRDFVDGFERERK